MSSKQSVFMSCYASSSNFKMQVFLFTKNTSKFFCDILNSLQVDQFIQKNLNLFSSFQVLSCVLTMFVFLVGFLVNFVDEVACERVECLR